jgi:hypothetical protein
LIEPRDLIWANELRRCRLRQGQNPLKVTVPRLIQFSAVT